MSVKIDQAFVNTFIDASFGLGIAHENIDYTPTAGTEYVELLNIPNNITSLALSGTNETDGIFRIILRWPTNKGSIAAKIKADVILNSFLIGVQVCYSGQCATITSTKRNPGYEESGWYKVVITINYKAFI